MFWSLQQPLDDAGGLLSSANAYWAPSISGSSLSGDVLNLSIGNAAFDTTVSSRSTIRGLSCQGELYFAI
ncbi:hypothetical protein TorRG33x02_101830, partial [Trema orientale]